MRVGIVDFMQEQADRLSWLPAGTCHRDQFSRRIVIFVCLYCCESIELRVREPAAASDKEEAIQAKWTATGYGSRGRHRGRRIEVSIPAPEKFRRGQSRFA